MHWCTTDSCHVHVQLLLWHWSYTYISSLLVVCGAGGFPHPRAERLARLISTLSSSMPVNLMIATNVFLVSAVLVC